MSLRPSAWPSPPRAPWLARLLQTPNLTIVSALIIGFLLATSAGAVWLTRLATALLPTAPAALQALTAELGDKILLCGGLLTVVAVRSWWQYAGVSTRPQLPGWLRLVWVLLALLMARIGATIWHLTGVVAGHPNLVHLLPLLVAVVVVAMALTALAEELLFRGLLLSGLLAAWGSSRAGIYRAVVVASAVFGAGHLVNLGPGGQLLAQVAYAAVVGLVWAGLRLRTGSIWPGVILHWLGNTAAMLTMLGSTSAWAVRVPMLRLGWAHLVFLPLLALSGVGLIEDYCQSLGREQSHQQPATAEISATRDEQHTARPGA